MTDGELLARHLAGDRGAFGELVLRHVDMVHAAARRQAVAHAEDVAQAAFILLSRKAGKLAGRTSVAGWLLVTTRLCAQRALRAEFRQHHYEREAGMHIYPDSTTDQAMLLALDAALAELSAGDRELVVRRHLQDRPLEEIAGDLRITVPAATKRVQRALEKLRGVFVRRGKSVGTAAIVTLLAGEAAHRAPAAALGAVGGGTPTVAARAIADAIVRYWALGTAKVAAVAGLIVALVAGSVMVAASGEKGPETAKVAAEVPATVPEVADDPAVPREPLIAAFDLLMDADAGERLRKVGTPVETKSNRYVAYRAKNDEVLRVLREAMAADAFFATQIGNLSFDRARGRGMEAAHAGPGKMTLFEPLRAGPAIFGMSSVSGGRAFLERTSKGLSFDVDLGDVRISTSASDEKSQEFGGAVRFKGEIVPGDTLFFLADAGAPAGHALAHAYLWQELAATRDQAEKVIRVGTYPAWISRGPSGTLALADRALVWQQGALNVAPTAEATHRLANGAEVRLEAIGRPQEFPFCWWKPDGTPAEKDWTGFEVPLEAARAVVLDFSVPAFAGAGESASPYFIFDHPDRRFYTTAVHNEVPWPLQDAVDSVEVGISCGAWEDAGTMAGVGNFAKGDLWVRIKKITPLDGENGVMPVVELGAPPELEVRLVAVDKGGKRHIEGHGDMPDEAPAIVVGIPPLGQKMDPNIWVAAAEVDHYVIQTRKREWTTFAHVPDFPTRAIPAKVDAREVAAARARLASQDEVRGAAAANGASATRGE